MKTLSVLPFSSIAMRLSARLSRSRPRAFRMSGARLRSENRTAKDLKHCVEGDAADRDVAQSGPRRAPSVDLVKGRMNFTSDFPRREYC